MVPVDGAFLHKASLSARRAWIEIRRPRPKTLTKNVALRKESVDRNNSPGGDAYAGVVALRKESVDRNSWAARARVAQYVALRKESVDRNTLSAISAAVVALSLSARRAWIEIVIP